MTKKIEKTYTDLICLDCNAKDEGTLLKEFDNEKSYSWFDLSKMTEVCACCGSENIREKNNE